MKLKLPTKQICILLTFLLLPLANGASDITERTTLLDYTGLRSFFHNFRNWLFNTIGKTGERTQGFFLQEKFPDDVDFPCDISYGKSLKVPTSVHKLRPGDFSVIAAMGDSLTAASGASATRFIDLSMENRGLAWSIGGQWNWRNVTTLPNILKVFNPKVSRKERICCDLVTIVGFCCTFIHL